MFPVENVQGVFFGSLFYKEFITTRTSISGAIVNKSKTCYKFLGLEGTLWNDKNQPIANHYLPIQNVDAGQTVSFSMIPEVPITEALKLILRIRFLSGDKC
ncbi:hypothetical protein HYR54_05660 [Candidatus Acetothermia bacterium]|nr:hypothetical protein [Candidatus Acetothermia bacterium]